MMPCNAGDTPCFVSCILIVMHVVDYDHCSSNILFSVQTCNSETRSVPRNVSNCFMFRMRDSSINHFQAISHSVLTFFFYFSTIYTPGLRLTFSTCLNKCAIWHLQCQVEEHSSEYPQSLELLG